MGIYGSNSDCADVVVETLDDVVEVFAGVFVENADTVVIEELVVVETDEKVEVEVEVIVVLDKILVEVWVGLYGSLKYTFWRPAEPQISV